jgi:predicted phosphodiesterase
MLTFKGYREYLSIPFDSTIHTIEMKVALDSSKTYIPLQKIPLAVKYNQYNEVDWTLGVYKEKQKYLGRAYFELNYPSYEIGIIGDYGIVNSPNTQSFAVAETLTEVNPDYIITLGDNTYETGTNAYDNTVGRLYQQFINPYIGVSGSGAEVNRFHPVIGNHDYFGGSYNQYLTFFPNTPRFYTFKKGNIQFFMLNSDINEPSGSTSSSDQATWLIQELSSSFNDLDVLWRIACFHHPYITSTTNAHSPTTRMDWPFASWGIDVCLSGHQHVYERLENNGIPFIINGLGGATLYSFTSVSADSKFRYADDHGYVILNSRGNKLTFSLYNKDGVLIPDTGSTTLPSCSIENGTFVMQKSTIPFSDRPFRLSDKYILSDPIPIFNGEIFNIMIRKNDPDELFEYNITDDIVPTLYDLWVQRREDGNVIFSSLTSDVFTKTYNYEFSNTGKLYFGNYQNSSSFVGQLDKILIYDTPIEDNTFNDHCNNINSYSYTGSFDTHESLYFRMNYDYPKDLSLSNPSVIINQNEIYSSSIWMEAYNFGTQAFSSSIDNCVIVSHSAYPYQFKEIPYNQTLTITSYGPNKFKNQKIQKQSFNLDVRLDPNDRSTYISNKFVSPDSNQIGLFADPNDYKNKDIFRYLGDFGVVSLIADPMQMYEDKYYPLKNIRETYNESGNKRTYYNEMFTLYKFYFDRSIFEIIKQLIPARNTILTGILIEPTVLERPKYQYKVISSEACDVEFTKSLVSCSVTSSQHVRPPSLSVNNFINSKGKVSSDLISVDFRTDKSIYSSQLYEHVPYFVTDISSQDPEYNSLLPKLQYVQDGWIKKYPDVGDIGNVEIHSDWPIPVQSYGPTGVPDTIPPININNTLPGCYFTGSGYYYLKNCHFYVKTNENISSIVTNLQKNVISAIDLSYIKLPTNNFNNVINQGIIKDIENYEELGVHCDDSGKIIETRLSGSISRFLIKNWTRQDLNFRKGEYSKPQSTISQSIYLYNTEVWKDPVYSSIIYTSSFTRPSVGNIYDVSNESIYSPNFTENGGVFVFYYDMGTFIGRPNSKRNDIYTTAKLDISNKFLYSTSSVDTGQYYETCKGYPRNHLIHKKITFTKESFPSHQSIDNIVSNIFNRYIKSRQTQDTTVDQSSLEDNSLPVQSINVSNINVVRTDNVLS